MIVTRIACPQPGNIDINPYVQGYTLLTRGGVCEIWHYISDRLVHVEPHELDAIRWCNAHPAIPKSGKFHKTWSELHNAPDRMDWEGRRAWSAYWAPVHPKAL
jgi:hypothetical protein